jgi:hypothetical protein
MPVEQSGSSFLNALKGKSSKKTAQKAVFF